ncbi:phosphotransferase [Pseudonocardia kujensis]|uniref:phosphotransferase n=1 Tax=Pseudonocardia kujensis TaxID=1128675 RepID=UPI001E43CE3F|nr:phosphotransferase [Pseudonocardia kujensis]MCE0765194.1 phosphotransferase [Pseudonocardia kujensis]
MTIDDARDAVTPPRGLVARPAAEIPAWRGLVVFVVREAAAHQIDEAVAGIARGLEILDVIELDAAQRAAARTGLAGADWGPGGRPVPGGGPHTFVVACDVAPPVGVVQGVRSMADRIDEVRARTTHRLLHRLPPQQHYEPLHVSSGPQQALDFLEVLGDLGVQARLLPRVTALIEACSVPFPLVRMLAPDSPGYRARVALVDHPVHGRTVCKIFRPGALDSFGRELRARQELADLPEVPELLEHGPNWLLTPFYTDVGRHLVRPLSGVKEMHQLRADVVRQLARFARDLHERGKFVLDLSPHNLLWDAHAGLKVLDLEFVLDYPGPVPPFAECWSLHGVPRELRRMGDGLPDLVLTKGVGNSVFHPAVSGLSPESLFSPPRRGETVRRTATQLAWYAGLAVAGRVHPAMRR